MRTEIKVRVTQKIIDEDFNYPTTYENPHPRCLFCPISRAILEQNDWVKHVATSNYSIVIVDYFDEVYSFSVPLKVVDLMNRLDERRSGLKALTFVSKLITQPYFPAYYNEEYYSIQRG